MKPGDLVRFKVSKLNSNHTKWLKDCAKSRTPMLILREYLPADEYWDGSIELELLDERAFEVMCEDVTFHAFEWELTKRGL